MKTWFSGISFLLLSFLFQTCSRPERDSEKIDRLALVRRHNVGLKEADTLGSLSVGNGEFAFTVDVSGLQTFPKEYENGIPLGTQSQWAWHSMPSRSSYSVKDVAASFESCDGTKTPYAVHQKEGKEAEITNVLRANPHRLHLGVVGLSLLKENGNEVQLDDLRNIHQQLDLWTGQIESTYEVEGHPVTVTLYGHQDIDGISARISSPLVPMGRLKIKIRFPYGNDCHVCAGYDWNSPDKHQSVITTSQNAHATIKRTLDSTVYFTDLSWSNGRLSQIQDAHTFILTPAQDQNEFEFSIVFSKDGAQHTVTFDATKKNSAEKWKDFWMSGGAVDFSGCRDPRANELERRVILSQYLTKIQCSGKLPPQETGLTMNSWYGKFHLEMHWWHATHFALWNRVALMEKSMGWYFDVMQKAKSTARWQGYDGARWQKMTDPRGDESPSDIGAFIIWQQPHPIYLAELLYRNDPTKRTLNAYRDLVFNTADFMASFLKDNRGTYRLCHPLIPAQEIFKATETDDPSYELQYWYYGLSVAQEWRTRVGLPNDEKWDKILQNLAPLPIKDNLYLPNATTPEAYGDDQYRRDHPSVVGAYGVLPFNDRIDTIVMKNTFEEIMRRWQWESTWGWDYPMLAMTAARLNKPAEAVDALLMNVPKNTYLVNGHNYQDKRLRLYLPGNGGLLAAVAMMAAGWEGSDKRSPGFPQDGSWNIRWEGLQKMP